MSEINAVEWLNGQLQIATRHEAALTAALWPHPAPACSPSCKSALAILRATREVSPAADALLTVVEEVEALSGVEDEKLIKVREAVARFKQLMEKMQGIR